MALHDMSTQIRRYINTFRLNESGSFAAIRQQNQANLLATLTLLGIPVSIIILVYRSTLFTQSLNTVLTSFAVVLAMLFTHLLSRTKYYRVGAYLLIFIGYTIVIFQVFEKHGVVDISNLYYAFVVTLVASWLISFRMLGLIIELNIAIAIAIQSTSFVLEPTKVVDVLSFLFVASIFLVVGNYYRNQLEEQRQAVILDREARLAAIVQRLPGLIWTTDENIKLTSLAGLQTDESKNITNPSIRDIFPEKLKETDDFFIDMHKKALRGELVRENIQWHDAHYDCQIRELRDKDNKITGCLGIAIDITEHKRLEAKELQLLLEQERTAILSNFITQTSHEFYTPLSIISVNTQLLSRLIDTEKPQQYLQQIEVQTKNITTLVGAMKMLAQFDTETAFHYTNTNISNLLTAIISNTKQAQTNEKSQTINVEIISPDIPNLNIDVQWFEEALQKILQNAIAFTPEQGTITLKAHQTDDNVVITVNDSGNGIAENDLPHIFERFYRVDKAGTTRGFGLGLPIAKAIIERHGGSIAVESEIDKGTTVRISLPIAH